MIPARYTEEVAITDAVMVALRQAHIVDADVVVHQERARGLHLPPTTVIRIRVLLPRWSLRRLWWWWHGLEAYDRVERRVRIVLSGIDGLSYTAATCLVFITVDEPFPEAQ
jgi:hypothetical protein